MRTLCPHPGPLPQGEGENIKRSNIANHHHRPTQAQLVRASELGLVLAVLVVSWQGAEMAPLTLLKTAATWRRSPPTSSRPISAVAGLPHRNGRHAANRRLGHPLAVVLSIPFGLMSAENLVPGGFTSPFAA